MSGSELETYSSCIACVPASGAGAALGPPPRPPTRPRAAPRGRQMAPAALLGGVGVFGGVFAAAGGDSPAGIRRAYGRKPRMPPAWVFEVVWGALFLCIGASAYL